MLDRRFAGLRGILGARVNWATMRIVDINQALRTESGGILHDLSAMLSRRFAGYITLGRRVNRRRVIVGCLALVVGTQSSAEEVWATAIARRPDGSQEIVYRYVKVLESSFEPRKLPYRVTILWPYETDSGMPPSSIVDAMYELEDKLEQELEATGQGKLVLISTGAGLRRWTYYVRARQDFEAAASRALRPRLRFPINLEGELDPEWRRLLQFKASVRE
jgi:hypothetical protein